MNGWNGLGSRKNTEKIPVNEYEEGRYYNVVVMNECREDTSKKMKRWYVGVGDGCKSERWCVTYY